MTISDIKSCDLLNGDGVRVSVWFNGCSHRCKGCQNPQTWDSNAGIQFDDVCKNKVYALLGNKDIKGLTLTGGDPLFEGNIIEMLDFVKEVRDRFPSKDIWMWTGYVYEMISLIPNASDILKLIDVLVDGPYIDELRDVDLKWRGSSNQRVIDVRQSLQKGSVVLYGHSYKECQDLASKIDSFISENEFTSDIEFKNIAEKINSGSINDIIEYLHNFEQYNDKIIATKAKDLCHELRYFY